MDDETDNIDYRDLLIYSYWTRNKEIMELYIADTYRFYLWVWLTLLCGVIYYCASSNGTKISVRYTE